MSKTIEKTLNENCTLAIENAKKGGKYTDHQANLHEATALFERKEAENKLVAELQKGIDSGFVEDWDFEEWLKEVKLKYKTHGPTHQ